jgi:glycosyltransferase involved in cell wall biosynthesis
VNRFAYICADGGIPLPGRKGSSVHVAALCRAFGRAGLDGTVYSTRARAETLAGFPLVALDTPSRSGKQAPEEGELRLVLGSWRSPAVIDAGCDFIYERYGLWHAGGLVRARELGVPFILEVNSPLPDEERRYRNLHHARLADGLAELLLRQADGVVCVSDAVAEWVRTHRRRDAGVWVVPNGVDAKMFASAPPVSKSDAEPVIAFCGSFRPWHGLDTLLEAFKLLVRQRSSAVRLLCVGDGPLREWFDSEVAGSALTDRVEVTGYVDQPEVARRLAGATVAVAPYPPLEQFYFSPLKLYEFLALGLPVVAGEIGQVGEILDGGRRGWLYPPGDVAALAARLSEVLDHPHEARQRATAGREWVLANATWDHRAAEILERIAAPPQRRVAAG